MPIKLKKSVKTFNKSNNKNTTEHFYIKNYSSNDLQKIVEDQNSKPKVVQKCRNELTKRR
tara:strand:- start:526 stop:705 length:180 start_codon:yes stop_codon:yes gene_type:complete